MSHADRAALLAELSPTLAALHEEARRCQPGEPLAGWLLTVREPSGYMLAAGLQRRFGRPSPEEILLPALQGRTPPRALLVGVGRARALAEVLEGLTPHLSALAPALRRVEPPGAPSAPLPIVVAACGAAELLHLPVPSATTSTLTT